MRLSIKAKSAAYFKDTLHVTICQGKTILPHGAPSNKAKRPSLKPSTQFRKFVPLVGVQSHGLRCKGATVYQPNWLSKVVTRSSTDPVSRVFTHRLFRSANTRDLCARRRNRRHPTRQNPAGWRGWCAAICVSARASEKICERPPSNHGDPPRSEIGYQPSLRQRIPFTFAWTIPSILTEMPGMPQPNGRIASGSSNTKPANARTSP